MVSINRTLQKGRFFAKKANKPEAQKILNRSVPKLAVILKEICFPRLEKIKFRYFFLNFKLKRRVFLITSFNSV